MSDDTVTPIGKGQRSRIHPDLLPMIHILILSLGGIPDQLRDHGASEADAADIQDATDLLTARLKRLL